MNILFLTKHELTWGSSKERIGNFLPYLVQKHKVHHLYVIPNKISRFWIGEKKSVSYLYFKMLSFFHHRIMRYVKFIQILKKAHLYDLIVIQKVTLPGFFLKMLQMKNNHLIFDVDDYCFIPQHLSFFKRLHMRWQLYQSPQVLKYYKHLIMGNPTLKKQIEGSHSENNITILPTSIDTRLFHPTKERRVHKLTIGWIGSGENHLKHLKLLRKPFETLGHHYPFQFVLIGCMGSIKIKEMFQSKIYSCRVIDWLPSAELAKEIQHFDIGVMPLVNDEVARSKCGFKALTYMASGVATLVSPVGINTDIIRDGQNGFLASNETEWFQKLILLIQNPQLRHTLGAEGRKTVQEKFSLENNANIFLQLLEKVGKADCNR